MTLPPLRTVIFDLDGTVIDTVPLIVESYQHTFRTVLGTERDETWIRSTIGTPLQTVLSAVDPARAEEMLKTYLEHNLARVHRCAPCPGIEETVTALIARGIAVGIATAKRRESAEVTLSRSALAGRLPVLAAFEDTERHKPDPDPVRHALAALGAEPGSAAYLGDAVVDVQAARAAGVTAVAVASGASSAGALAAAGPNLLLHRVDELLRHL